MNSKKLLKPNKVKSRVKFVYAAAAADNESITTKPSAPRSLRGQRDLNTESVADIGKSCFRDSDCGNGLVCPFPTNKCQVYRGNGQS